MIVIGLVLAFVVAGTIEGFVTGSSLPTVVRVGIGVAVEAAFVGWIVVQGREAEARGITGVLGERPAPGPRKANLRPSPRSRPTPCRRLARGGRWL